MTGPPPPATVVPVHRAWHGEWCSAAVTVDPPGHGERAAPFLARPRLVVERVEQIARRVG
ncbi:MAG TPA: hypothetical protein VH986_09055 [Acidimicrobiia bacterium]|jgi:hypothetical protein